MLGLQLRLASSRSSRKHDAERNKKASKKSQVDQSVIVSVKSSDLYMKIHENMNMEMVLHEEEEGKKNERERARRRGVLGRWFRIVAATAASYRNGLTCSFSFPGLTWLSLYNSTCYYVARLFSGSLGGPSRYILYVHWKQTTRRRYQSSGAVSKPAPNITHGDFARI